jgi:hypothetical protein
MIFNFSKKKETLIFPNRKEVVGDGEGKYVGEVKNGKANGFGTLIYPHPNVPETEEGDKYIGEFKNGIQHGNGKIFILNGTFEGKFKNGEAAGKGDVIYSDGKKRVGPYKDLFFKDRFFK